MLLTFMETREPHIPTQQLTFENILAGITAQEPVYAQPHPRTIDVDLAAHPQAYSTMLQEMRRVCNTLEPLLQPYEDMDMSTCYTHFTIPKASGGERPIDAPNTDLKNTLTNIRITLAQAGILAHTAAYAYVPGRCAKDAVIRHQKTEHKYYLKLDLHNFFGSCTKDFIKDRLKKICYFYLMPDEFIDKLLHIAMLNGSLPQGSPLSPWLTNQIMLPFDFELTNWCKKHNITYTRYADDMLFSANFNPQNLIEEKVTTSLENTPLTINTDKTHLTTTSGRNWNLGIMTNKDNNLTVGYRKKELARAMLTEFCKNHESWNAQQAQELLGIFAYLSSIEPEYFQNLLTKYSNKFNVDITTELKRIIKEH